MTTAVGWSSTFDTDMLSAVSYPDHEVVELPILLPEWQVAALEDAARRRGMTVGQLVRRLFADLFPKRTADSE